MKKNQSYNYSDFNLISNFSDKLFNCFNNAIEHLHLAVNPTDFKGTITEGEVVLASGTTYKLSGKIR
jgi:hypothetical protein